MERKIVGAGWLKSTERGEYISLTFKAEELSGVDLSQCWVNMSVNRKKSQPKQPDYLIFAQPKEDSKPQAKRGASAPSSFPKPQNSFTKNNDDDDIPF